MNNIKTACLTLIALCAIGAVAFIALAFWEFAIVDMGNREAHWRRAYPHLCFAAVFAMTWLAAVLTVRLREVTR